MERLLWICLAGAAGTGARYLVGVWATQRFGSPFPHGTLIVNLAGCFALGAVMHAALALSWSPTLRAAVTIGFIGGLTTYSTFNYETNASCNQANQAPRH
jgi:CrcB protein